MKILKYGLILLVLTFTSVFSNNSFEINLNVRNDIGNSMNYNTSFGISPLATDVLDTELNELLMPPPPFVGFYAVFEFIDSTFIENDGSKYYDRIWTNKDIRNYSDTLKLHHNRHRMIYRFGNGNKMLINWKKEVFPNFVDSVFLRDKLNGFVINYNMKEVSSMEWENQDIKDLNIDIYYNFTNTSIVDDTKNELNLFPNPTPSVLYIDSNIEYDRLEIVNMLGLIVLEATNSKQIDLSNLPSGNYFFRAYKNGQTFVHNVVKN
jgi:hypothetical protein